MLPNPSLDEQAVIADTLRRPRMSLTARDRIGEGLLSVALVAVVVPLWVLSPPGSFAVLPALVSWLMLAVASRIRIDTPFGCTYPTQLAFVPLLFVLPGALVPVAVVAASMICRVPDLIAGNLRLSRLVHAIPNGWYAIGPVAVFAIAGVSPQRAGPALLVAALAAQFVVDFLAAWLRFAIARGASLAEHLRASWVIVVDAALSVVALLAAEQVHRTPLAAVAPLPLLALVALFARERRQRLESLIEMNSAYRRARDEAVEASNLKSAFLRNVSHEIRTPMNGVMGMNDLLLTTDLSDEQRQFATQVRQSSEHMLAVINDLLDISKIETGRIDVDAADFDLREAVESACAIGDLEARAKGVMLEVEIDRGLPRLVHGDRGRVRQVLLNIVGNAVKFTAKGTVTVRVRRAPSMTDGIHFEVTDTGIGIDPALIDRMFEPFMQADVSTTRRFGGNGLGLAIAKELVELMGGSVGANSVPAVGSVFWFELPMAEAVRTAVLHQNREHVEATRVEADPQRTRGRSGGPARVLVVEDSPVNRLVAQHVLERGGFVAHVVTDGREALQALSTQSYDAVLMDCQMPEIDGYEATRELRRREAGGGRHTPVIAMTAHAMTGDRERCIEAGMDDYVTKPVRSQVLSEVLHRWIDEVAPPVATDAPARLATARTAAR